MRTVLAVAVVLLAACGSDDVTYALAVSNPTGAVRTVDVTLDANDVQVWGDSFTTAPGDTLQVAGIPRLEAGTDVRMSFAEGTATVSSVRSHASGTITCLFTFYERNGSRTFGYECEN